MHRVPTGATITLLGDLDMATVSKLEDCAAAVFDDADGTELTVDLAELRFCDSAGISALVRIRQLCDQHGWQLRTLNPQPAVRRVFDFTGLSGHLNVVGAAS